MSEPIKHHYIPVFYLKSWANEKGNVCEFSRPNKHVTYKWRSPTATGYQVGLYTLPGVPADSAQLIEKEMMSLVDATAAQAKRLFANDDPRDLTGEERAGWARFLYAMMFRNPEQIAGLQERYSKYVPEMVERIRAEYDMRRGTGDPLTFEEFKEKFLANPLNTSGLHIVPRLLNSQKIIGHISGMRFWTYRLRQFAGPAFLTSDRPVIMTNGLAKPKDHIVMPLSPTLLFIAAHDDWLYNEFRKRPQHETVRRANEKVTEQSHKYVYGADTSQRAFIAKRIGKKVPSTPMG